MPDSLWLIYCLGVAVTVRCALLITAFLAARKGYAWYCWIFSCGFVGLIVLAFLPFANRPGVSPQLNDARRRTGNIAGIILSVIEILSGVSVGVLLAISMIPPHSLSPWNAVIWLAIQLPLLLTCVVGIVLLMIWCSKCPRAALLAMLGLAIILMEQVFVPVSHFAISQWLSPGYRFIQCLYHAIGIASSFFSAVGTALLLAAIVAGRSRGPSTPQQ